MSLDLDAVIAKKRTVKLFGRDVEIKEMTTEEYLKSQELVSENFDVPEGADIVKLLAQRLEQYLMLVLDVNEEEAASLDYRQVRALREYLSELDLKDQGFTDKEIAMMAKRAQKNQMEQVMQIAGSQ
jgi:hypothetical protein